MSPNTSITVSPQDGANRAVILPQQLENKLASTNRRAMKQRLTKYAMWLDQSGGSWAKPDLAAYRDTMLDRGLKASTVNAHLATIRGRYDDLLTDNATLAQLRADARAYLEANAMPVDAANIKAATDMAAEAIRNGIAAKKTNAKEHKKQDRAASEFTRLTKEQASALLAAPGTEDLKALRDTAVIGMLLCTGLREAELAALQVEDLRQRKEDGALAVRVEHGKGNKQRLVPYGALEFVLAIVDAWTRAAGIDSGPVFRGLYKPTLVKDDKGNVIQRLYQLRPGRLSVRAIQYILADYPVMIDGEKRAVKPHDCRRSYAKLCRDAGMPIDGIQQNLGHADPKTTMLYIGERDSEFRKPAAIIDFDLAALNGVA